MTIYLLLSTPSAIIDAVPTARRPTADRRRTARSAEPRATTAYRLVVRTLDAYFALREAGRRLGAVSERGGGTWGLLRILAEGGPTTVPRIADLRGVTRQRIQQIVDELADAGLVVLADNPRHRRSRLVTLTREGRRRFDVVDARVRAAAVEHTRAIASADLGAAVRSLEALLDSLASAGAGGGRSTA